MDLVKLSLFYLYKSDNFFSSIFSESSTKEFSPIKYPSFSRSFCSCKTETPDAIAKRKTVFLSVGFGFSVQIVKGFDE